MNAPEILENARQMIADGNSAGAREYALEHFKELPEDVQGDLLIALLIESGEKTRLRDMRLDIQEAGLAALDAIDAAEGELKKLPE